MVFTFDPAVWRRAFFGCLWRPLHGSDEWLADVWELQHFGGVHVIRAQSTRAQQEDESGASRR